jgi:hypothetical protein
LEQTKRKDNLSSLENESENILAEINQNEDELISKIRALAQTTRETFNLKLTEVQKTLEEDIKTISSAITKVSLNVENISSGNELEIFANVKHVKIAVKDHIKRKVLLRDLSGRSNRKMLCFVANEKLKAGVNELECIGIVNILEEEKKEDLKIKAVEQKTDSSNNEFREEIKEEKLNVEVGDEKKTDPEVLRYTAIFSNKYKVTESRCKVTAACILENKSLMLFDNTNRVLKRLSMGNFQTVDQLGMHESSYSICGVNRKEIAVALFSKQKI